MKICVIYDTKKNSTKVFSKWIKEDIQQHNIDVDIFKYNEFNNKYDYDLFIIGSPIYYEKPLKGIMNFLEENSSILKEKKTAVFIVCMAQLFGKATEKYIKNHYLRPLEEKVGDLVVESGVFWGWIRKINEKDRDKVKKWANEIVKKLGD
ncbi:flavodoxin domain-containing protein [Marinitoga sp. 1138]|uniref:flavodoxin domain-containing protein n=1 Tax=Marinitoga sp. 1138 TaxID=1643334 RepID=UPI0015862E31|nr:flavodoxin domain-containing protein [Marinitoga sp. 1138]NUU98530.1 hypothetical protein [Marinitoga sp. 1138]